MRSRTTRDFRNRLDALPASVRRAAREVYRQFQVDPRHNSLQFKQVHPRLPIYSVRITKKYRAVGKRDDKGMLWFWIGSHADYEQTLKNV
ncbi:MAG: hypothetical protein OXF97_04585 [Nitrospira sp.]|nr:hypothetical protein [Nitrospira sp.]